MFAATKGYLDLIDTLLKNIKKDNVNVKDSFGKNALFYAILAEKGDNADIVYHLIKAGINPNEVDNVEGNTALIIATNKNMKDTVKCLLEFGANPNIQNLSGNSALHVAVINNSTSIDIIKLLIHYKANLELPNKENSNSLDLAVKLNKTNIYEILAIEKNLRESMEKTIIKELEHDNNLNPKTQKKKFLKSQELFNNDNNKETNNTKDKKMSSNNAISNTTFGLMGTNLSNNILLNNDQHPIINSNLINNNQNVPSKGAGCVGGVLGVIINNDEFTHAESEESEFAFGNKNNNFNNQTQNINININNMSLNQNPLSRTYNKFKPVRSKLCKKNFIFNEKTHLQNRNESSSIEIPFNFSNKFSNSSHMHTYISNFHFFIKFFRNEESSYFKYRYI